MKGSLKTLVIILLSLGLILSGCGKVLLTARKLQLLPALKV